MAVAKEKLVKDYHRPKEFLRAMRARIKKRKSSRS
jgi:hypothetical protein